MSARGLAAALCCLSEHRASPELRGEAVGLVSRPCGEQGTCERGAECPLLPGLSGCEREAAAAASGVKQNRKVTRTLSRSCHPSGSERTDVPSEECRSCVRCRSWVCYRPFTSVGIARSHEAEFGRPRPPPRRGRATGTRQVSIVSGRIPLRQKAHSLGRRSREAFLCSVTCIGILTMFLKSSGIFLIKNPWPKVKRCISHL